MPATHLAPAESPAQSPSGTRLPEVGEAFDDFLIERELGRGAFGRVFLARQQSLGRLVAVKITPDRGSEARALAHLEHDHIVKVYSESSTALPGWRTICMQFVAGATLDRVIRKIDWQAANAGSGSDILRAVDAMSADPSLFDPVAWRDREQLDQLDWVEAVCWLGSRLADALAFAHRRGVIHYDVKPANVLLNCYGRPMLVDFNLAPDPHVAADQSRRAPGGTPLYMAPEHLDAMYAMRDGPPPVVDARADVYSLGLVLFELASGQRPHAPPENPEDIFDIVEHIARARSAVPASLQAARPVTPNIVERTLRHCLAPHAEERYSSSHALAEALDGCRAWRYAEKRLPPPGPIARLGFHRPFLTGMLLAFVPHLVGSAVNIGYNASRIIARLDDAQRATFRQIALGYNMIVYPLCVYLAWWCIGRATAWARHGGERGAVATNCRRHALALPAWAAFISALGWLPGAVIFPALLHQLAGPISRAVAGHFVISFTVSGLIALTYSVMLMQYFAVRVLYPDAWDDGTGFTSAAGRELRVIDRRLGRLQVLAGLIPLCGAVLLIGFEADAAIDRIYRMLVAALIVLGMAGFVATQYVCDLVRQSLTALRGRPAQGEEP